MRRRHQPADSATRSQRCTSCTRLCGLIRSGSIEASPATPKRTLTTMVMVRRQLKTKMTQPDCSLFCCLPVQCEALVAVCCSAARDLAAASWTTPWQHRLPPLTSSQRPAAVE
uniref:Uncharacterized protein n=1 Tax=Macrostomum lignano TaxID=282301 RepID=A0A1I8G241_9PLAT